MPENPTPAPTTAQLIAREALGIYDGDPARWTQGAYYRDRRGKAVEPAESAACMCLLAAIEIASGRVTPDEAGFDELVDGIVEATGVTPEEWNDAPGRTFEEVEAMLKRFA